MGGVASIGEAVFLEHSQSLSVSVRILSHRGVVLTRDCTSVIKLFRTLQPIEYVGADPALPAHIVHFIAAHPPSTALSRYPLLPPRRQLLGGPRYLWCSLAS